MGDFYNNTYRIVNIAKQSDGDIWENMIEYIHLKVNEIEGGFIMFIAGCIVGGIGGVFLLLGITFCCVGKKIWKCTEQVNGRIVNMCMNAYDYNHGETGNSNIGIKIGGTSPGTRCPVFSYMVNGVEYSRASNVAWNIGMIKRKMQQPQTIYYNPDNPQQSSLSRQSVWSTLGKVFILVGLVMIVVGLAFLV